MHSKRVGSTRVVLLGTGTPNADPDRSGPSLAVVTASRAYLVDFGPGVVRRAAAACRYGIDQLHVSRLDTAFLTHLHSDHTAGYPDLVLTPWVLGRDRPLCVYGPPGLAAMTSHILAAYDMDREMRVCGLEPSNPGAFGANATEIGPGVCYRDAEVEVEAFEVNHGEGWLALGYQFRSRDRRIVISGDTAPTEGVIELWKGCDVLVHEVYSAAGHAEKDPAWSRYHAAMHTSTRELAEIANRVQPSLLLLTHILFWGASDTDIVAEIRAAGYQGRVICGMDLGIY